VDDGHIGFLDGSIFELSGQSPVGFIAFGDEHDSGGVAVEAVEDSRSPFAADGAPFFSVKDESVDESSGPSAARGVHDEIGLFVQSQEMFVFVNDVEWEWVRGLND
jgi:hypothetical protein